MKLRRPLITALLALGVTVSAVPAAVASTTPPAGGGSAYVLSGCSPWKVGGVQRTSNEQPQEGTRVDAVYTRSCLYHQGRTLYARTMWYSPHGGTMVGVIYANVQDCGTKAFGPSPSYTKHENPYRGPTTRASATSTYSGLDRGTAGHYYRSRGRMSGTLTVKLKYYLDEAPTTPNVSTASGCFRV